jgi:hypothetical protein
MCRMSLPSLDRYATLAFPCRSRRGVYVSAVS